MRTFGDVCREHAETLAAMASSYADVERIAAELAKSLKAGRRVLICGNGGSAADAQHIAGELVGRFKRDRAAMPAIALGADVATMTAVANDMGYERVFARQVEALLQPGDVLWMLSTSGNSPNVLAAARAGRERSACCLIGFTGQSGGELAPLCDLVFRAPHASSDRIQEMHQIAYHYICEHIEQTIDLVETLSQSP